MGNPDRQEKEPEIRGPELKAGKVGCILKAASHSDISFGRLRVVVSPFLATMFRSIGGSATAVLPPGVHP
jgi:hypothetical protein